MQSVVKHRLLVIARPANSSSSACVAGCPSPISVLALFVACSPDVPDWPICRDRVDTRRTGCAVGPVAAPACAASSQRLAAIAASISARASTICSSVIFPGSTVATAAPGGPSKPAVVAWGTARSRLIPEFERGGCMWGLRRHGAVAGASPSAPLHQRLQCETCSDALRGRPALTRRGGSGRALFGRACDWRGGGVSGGAAGGGLAAAGGGAAGASGPSSVRGGADSATAE